MRLTLFIANRYLLAKKSHNLINIITWISILGISVGSFALIVVLSAFNGLERVISSMNNRLTPDLQIAAKNHLFQAVYLLIFQSHTLYLPYMLLIVGTKKCIFGNRWNHIVNTLYIFKLA